MPVYTEEVRGGKLVEASKVYGYEFVHCGLDRKSLVVQLNLLREGESLKPGQPVESLPGCSMVSPGRKGIIVGFEVPRDFSEDFILVWFAGYSHSVLIKPREIKATEF